jgi:putative heme-binding domain-containing protein
LTDEIPGVRENAIKLAELHLEESPGLEDALLDMKVETDARVQFQLLCTLGELSSPRARSVHRQFLFAHVDSPWMQVAGLTAAGLDAIELFQESVARLSDGASDERRQFFRRVSSLVAKQADDDQIADFMKMVLDDHSESTAWWRAASLEGFAEGLEHAGTDDGALVRERSFMVDALMRTETPDLRHAYLNILEKLGLPIHPSTTAALEQAATVAAHRMAAPDLRVDALYFLGMADTSVQVELFESLIRPDEPNGVQRAAVLNLAKVDGDAVARFLLDRWDQMTPGIRQAAILAFIGNEDRKQLLLDAVETGQIEPSAIGWDYRVELMAGASNERARTLLKRRTEEGHELVEKYEDSIEWPGNVARGKQVFRESCAQCHARDPVAGGTFGPDLSSVRHRSEHWLLTQILIPDNSIADNFEQWIVEYEDGGVLVGIITEETATSITVMNMVGEETAILRTSIASFEAFRGSAMPGGLESQIDPREMADLLSFLKGR